MWPSHSLAASLQRFTDDMGAVQNADLALQMLRQRPDVEIGTLALRPFPERFQRAFSSLMAVNAFRWNLGRIGRVFQSNIGGQA